jgi:molybdopterin/thiamine biosynthesis adenylyltransferase
MPCSARHFRPDAILDGCDNFATRLAVADASQHRLRIPLVSAAVAEFEGQLGVFRGWEADKPCYRCFVGHDPERAGISCAEQGVLGALTGVMGSLAALEAIRAIVPFGEDPCRQAAAGRHPGLPFPDANASRRIPAAPPAAHDWTCHAPSCTST